MTFADHFSAIAARYATYRPRYPAALVDVLADRTPAGPGPRVAWEAGCGSGQLSVALAARFEQVIATDPSQAQLAMAIAHPRVAYRCAPAEASGLPEHVADLVVAAQAAHWFDWPRFVAEAGRVARPGALVALVSYGILQLAGEAGAIATRFYQDVVGPYWSPARAHVETGYRDLVLPWPDVPAPAVEMTARWTRDQLLGYIGTWSATVRLIEREGPGPVEALHDQLVRAWPGEEVRTIRWPLAIRLARR